MRTTASLNSRAAVFQESLALPFKRNVLNEMLEFVTLTSRFSGHSFKLEAQDFILHISQRSFPNFGLKILLCFVFSKKSSEFLFFLILFSAGIYLLKACLKHSQNGNIFFFLYSQVAYNCSN